MAERVQVRDLTNDEGRKLLSTSHSDGCGSTTWHASTSSSPPSAAAARPHRLYPALHLTAHTGMRRGEVVGLKWGDLDATAHRLSIRRTLQCVGGQPVELGVKTRTSRRSVELDAATVNLLRR